jgi:hypothetical protein
VVKRDASSARRSGPDVAAGTMGQWEMTHRSENFVESRRAGSVEMFEVSQPAGSFPDPPTPSYNLQIIQRCLGHASMEFGGHRFGGVPLPGDMVLSPSHQACSYIMDASTHVVILPLDAGLVRRVADELVPTFADDFGDLHTQILSSSAVCRSALSTWNSAKPGAGKTFDGHAATIELIELLLRFSVSPGVLRRQRHHIAPTALHRVMHYVEACLAEDVSLGTRRRRRRSVALPLLAKFQGGNRRNAASVRHTTTRLTCHRPAASDKRSPDHHRRVMRILFPPAHVRRAGPGAGRAAARHSRKGDRFADCCSTSHGTVCKSVCGFVGIGSLSSGGAYQNAVAVERTAS